MLALGAIFLWAGLGPDGSSRRAEAEAAVALASVDNPSRSALDRAQASTERVASLRPLDARAVARQAYIERLRQGRLTAESQTLLLRSYQLEPLGPGLTLWRVRLIFDHWADARPALRRAALAEVSAVFPRQGWEIQAMAPQIADPQGRMMLAIVASRLRAGEDLNLRPQQPAWAGYSDDRPDGLR